MRKFDPRGLLVFLVAGLDIALDQYLKHLVRQNLPLNVSWNPISWLNPIVTLTYVRNTGAAFGLLPNTGRYLIPVAVVVVVLVIVFYRQISASSWVLRLAFGFEVAGAIGNMIDRIVRGYVTDFVDFRVWPVFNLADMSVVVGTSLLVYYTIFMDRPRKVEQPALPTATSDGPPTPEAQ